MKEILSQNSFSGGAKNYGYITNNGKMCVKVRRFLLITGEVKQLNYEVMKRNILQEIQDPLPYRRNTNVVNPCHFVREPASKRIKNCGTCQKVWTCVRQTCDRRIYFIPIWVQAFLQIWRMLNSYLVFRF